MSGGVRLDANTVQTGSDSTELPAVAVRLEQGAECPGQSLAGGAERADGSEADIGFRFEILDPGFDIADASKDAKED